jgi:cellulose synthase/poly-beta-1,6-N-acetylglucosamine synthase-like glycosyltransferase
VDLFLVTALLPAGVALVWAVMLTLQAQEQKRYVGVSRRGTAHRWLRPPRVLVCVPCKGVDSELANNLRCILAQNYRNFHVRFVVESASDPACAVIQRLIADSAACELLVAGRCTDSGQKVHNLLCATAYLPDDVKVLAFFDADARPNPDALSRLVDRACGRELQVATGYRWLVPRRASLSNLTLASVNAAVAGLLNRQGWNLIWGGGWAIERELFEKSALTDAWRGTLSDDLVASRAMRLAGAKIAFEPGCMVATPIDVSWREAIEFLRRQFLIGRCYAPGWWWATAPLIALQPCVLFGGLLLAIYMSWRQMPHWYWPLVLSAVLYATSVLRAHWRQVTWSPHVLGTPETLRAAARFDRWFSPLSCLFAASVMLAAAVGRSIVWKGICYHIGPAGRITVLGRALTAEQRRAMTLARARYIKRNREPARGAVGRAAMARQPAA